MIPIRIYNPAILMVADGGRGHSLVPVCTVCKKVRDDAGFWHGVAGYLTHPDTTLYTHGYCPSCHERALSEIDTL